MSDIYTRAALQRFRDTGERLSEKYKYVTIAADGRFMHGDREIIALEDIPAKLTELYNDPQTGLKSAAKFWDYIKTKYAGIRKREVYNFVNNHETAQIQKPVRQAKTNRPIVIKKPNNLWQADLIDVSKYAGQNNNVHYLLCVVDVFSKFAYVEPIKNKEDSTVANAFDKIFTFDKPRTLQTDNGKEFANRQLAQVCREHGVRHITSQPYNPRSNGAVERFNKTFKHLMAKFMVHYNKKHYVSALPDLVANYNNTVHSTTKYTPADASEAENKPEIVSEIYDRIVDRAEKSVDKTNILNAQLGSLHIGDYVRLANITNKEVRKNKAFRKGYDKQWSHEIYRIGAIDYPHKSYMPVVYYIFDPVKQDLLRRKFFRDQLQLVDPEKIKKFAGARDPEFGEGEVFDREAHMRDIQANRGEVYASRSFDAKEALEERKEEKKRESRPNANYSSVLFDTRTKRHKKPNANTKPKPTRILPAWMKRRPGRPKKTMETIEEETAKDAAENDDNDY